MMTYDERNRLKQRRSVFNTAASFYNMIAYAKTKNDAEEIASLKGKVDTGKDDVKSTLVKIENVIANENEQQKLADIFKTTAEEVSAEHISPVDTNRYVANRDFYDDALLITFLIDSGADKGPLKKAEQNARQVAHYGQGEIEDPANEKYWEVEMDERYKALYQLVGV